ncbi:MAG TPA: amidase [Polyangiaceae bacterium]|jgi:aspartyl-tRNA(Asn)/glutamyl-tRNA(Gln) amidotransferase subunit A|nr:amidase [Polyangiaceae bacterium]
MALNVGRLSGPGLTALLTVMRTPARYVAAGVVRSQLGIDRALALPDSDRGEMLNDGRPVQAHAPASRHDASLGVPAPAPWQTSCESLRVAYESGQCTPRDVVRRALDRSRALARRSPSIGPIHLEDEARALAAADESARRFERREARALEGVVMVVKEELDVEGLPTGLGTSFLTAPAVRDATAVARLRAAGAIVLGQSPMTQFGMSPLGANPHRRMPHNAHDPSRLAGGSSTGSAVAVATGVVPVALGFDGGGSIRIPAALNGVFGLKPTFGRIPTDGHGLSGGSSVIHAGPIGATPHDLALFLASTCGASEGDAVSASQPPLSLATCVAALGRGVRGLRIGIDEAEWAAADPDVAGPARAAVAALEREGATVHSIAIPLASHAAAIGYLTIGLEESTALRELRRRHEREMEQYIQLFLIQTSTFSPTDYLDAQRLRSRLREQTAAALRTVDLIALPTTNSTAPRVTEREMKQGFVDPDALNAISRYSYVGNLTGIPAGTAPVGTARDGLPVGLQLLGDAWDEAVVLQALAHLQRIGVATPMRAATHGGTLLELWAERVLTAPTLDEVLG